MYSVIVKLINHQVKFFTYYFAIVILLIIWSYIEGVGDISGYILFMENGKAISSKFKAGYLSSLNYGIYYLVVLPLFIRSVFSTYSTAEKISNLPTEENSDAKINLAIKEYSSTIISFLKKRYSPIIFIALILFFVGQNILVERNDYKAISLGWVQGMQLKDQISSINDTITIRKKFYFRNSIDSTYVTTRLDSVKVTHLSFASSRKPNVIEFIAFVSFAKLFFALFTSIVFFFNFNILFGLFKFFQEESKIYLFRSPQFVKTMDTLVSHISLSGFFLTIFLFFRYVTNAQKGSFKPFDWDNILASDQYLFLLGMIFIPVSAIVLFTYVYLSNQAIDLKKLSWRNIISFYIPNISFLLIFFIYLINFDSFMESQLSFMRGVLKFIDKLFLG